MSVDDMRFSADGTEQPPALVCRPGGAEEVAITLVRRIAEGGRVVVPGVV
jgi:hypothetical protein